MRTYNYTDKWQKLLTPEIVGLLTAIHEYKGEQTLFIETKPDVLTYLLEIAKVQSTEASNKIEGIYTSDDRIKKIVSEKTMPRTRSEQEIAGYRDVLATIHENYDFIPVRPNMILQLHRDLYKFNNPGFGGNYKNSDNIIAEEQPDGTKLVRFQPVPAWETPEAIETLCNTFNDAINDPDMDPLLLMPIFILDFLCIHPFNDGNGRMSRLLTLLLLYQNGYIVGKYISLEKLIEQSKETYYETLQQSSANWNDGTNDYMPFMRYMLGIILKSYREFENRVEHIVTGKLNKTDRIRLIFEQKLGKISKSDIANTCPDISISMIERTLKEMLDKGEITKVGSGRATTYVKK